jgi:NADP-dependent alcohol dehydrogenase
MKNFTFHNPTRILFGKGRIADIKKEIPSGARILITRGGKSALKNGALSETREALRGFDFLEFDGIEPNPAYETLMKAVDLSRREKIDFLLAIGGGSVIDGTKFIAAAVPFAGEPWDILEKRAKIADALPFGVVLTLPATGSEMNNGAVISRIAGRDKLAFSSARTFSRFSVLDPTKTYSLPERQTANGVIDAFVHVVEQYLTFPAQAKVQDRFSEGLLLTLIEEGPRALKNPTNYDARANIMWAATMALNGLIAAGVPNDWATHMLGHEITALYGLDHAQTLAVVLPAMLDVRREEKREKLLQYADRVWNLDDGAPDARIDRAIEKTREFFVSLGVKTWFSDYGIGPDAIPVLLSQLERHGMTALGEHGDFGLDAAKKTFERAL